MAEEKPNQVRQWKSLEEWEQTPEYKKLAESEFMSSPLSESESPSARRDFLKLMGASIALSSAGCLRRPTEKIIPYVNRPKEIVLGVANYYTSTLIDNGEGFGVVVKTREGRPIKVDGNPEHPVNMGGSTSRLQASVLSLYDPDRLRAPKKNLHNEERSNRDTISSNWEEADKAIKDSLGNGRAVVLTSTTASPSSNRLIGEFVRKFGGEHVVYDSFGADDVSEGQRLSYGKSLVPRYRFDRSQLTVSIDADFLGTYLSPAEFTRQFNKTRDPDGDMSRLVVFESMMSLTGSNSDERHRIKPSQQLDVAVALIKELVPKSRYSSDSNVKGLLSSFSADPGVDSSAIKKLAEDLWRNRGKSLVIAGGMTSRTANSVDLQVAVNFLNSLLDNDGKTVDYKNEVLTQKGSFKKMNELISDMNSGLVETLIIHGANPAYTLPMSSGFIQALSKVKTVVHAGEATETGLVSDFMLPAHHEMENWGDSEIQEGVFSIQQPTIRAMYDSRSFQDMLLMWMGKKQTWYDYVRGYWRQQIIGASGFDKKWDDVLQTGVFTKGANRDAKSSGRQFRTSNLRSLRAHGKSAEYELVLYPKIGIGDGKYANLSWLQELPDPVTKVVWDNYLNVSPATAKEMGLKEGRVVKLKVGSEMVEVPVHIQPGVHDKVFALAVGYGRWGAGKVANGVGVNAYNFARLNELNTAFAGLNASIEKTRKTIEIANTQGHHTMFHRPIAAQTTLGQYKEDQGSGIYHAHFHGEIWPEHKYPGHKWGMVVDTNACTGCSACVTACQSENNIPVVGKKYVLQGREMHWLRIDRYYSEEPDNPETLHQAMLCQHCDNAPCETVCPVVATSHSSEGLNEMTYNRCVGTRYCANNCPYKVRRFNWFNYMKYREPEQMALNPEVAVRSRGVMEKCSFCVQRIKEAKNIAKDEKRPLKDGDFQVACEQACPGGGIVFGDTNDPESRVSKLMKKKRAYDVLPDLNAKSAVKYLTKVRVRDKKEGEGKGGHH